MARNGGAGLRAREGARGSEDRPKWGEGGGNPGVIRPGGERERGGIRHGRGRAERGTPGGGPMAGKGAGNRGGEGEPPKKGKD